MGIGEDGRLGTIVALLVVLGLGLEPVSVTTQYQLMAAVRVLGATKKICHVSINLVD